MSKPQKGKNKKRKRSWHRLGNQDGKFAAAMDRLNVRFRKIEAEEHRLENGKLNP